MITSDFTGLTADLGLPSEAELTGLANQLFTDIDGSLFEPEVCEEGIEKLVTTGDTGVFDTAAQKAQRVFGDLGVSDFEKIASELYVSQQPNEEKNRRIFSAGGITETGRTGEFHRSPHYGRGQ